MAEKEYPKFTVILRDYSFKQADAVVKNMLEYGQYFGVEVTLNTQDAIEIIHHLQENYGDRVQIGAGTVRTLDRLQQAVEAGAQFALGPHTFTKEMLDYCKQENIIAVPSAMTPSEVSEMFAMGADIVKVFPATVVGPRFFKDIQAPLGKLPLMAVGGVNMDNMMDFFHSGASYVGIGGNMFEKSVLESLDDMAIKATFENYIRLLEK